MSNSRWLSGKHLLIIIRLFPSTHKPSILKIDNLDEQQLYSFSFYKGVGVGGGGVESSENREVVLSEQI